jgi:MoaA/NifB/PqqE/SkfB family radical SAM enzyme
MHYRYGFRDYLHYFQMFRRLDKRQKAWGKLFEEAIRNGTYELPWAAAVQIIPTEACNLRCPMCQQWGKNGYFLTGVRPVQHMEKADLTTLMRGLSPESSFISIHGGEPFVYKHFSTLLALLAEKQFDVMFSTNGTLITKYVEPLAELKNLALLLLLSIDGDEETHDMIRGKGRFRQAKEGLAELFEIRRSRNMTLPFVTMNFVVCEYNPDVIEKVYHVAQEFGVFFLNYIMRWFSTEEIGLAYEKHLQAHFNLKSTGAWRGGNLNPENDFYKRASIHLRQIFRKQKYNPFPPYVVTMPKHLRGNDFDKYFTDYLNVFGNESCFMPFYWARIHANGELIYCPGHPDIIAGNVFRDGFLTAFNSETSIKFRKHILLHNRFPICNRCCGLYMTYPGRPYEQKARRNLGLNKEVAISHS